MNDREIVGAINFIEDKNVFIEDNWFLHATRNMANVNKILYEGIKCADLIGKENKKGVNGKYYISVFKASEFNSSGYNAFRHFPIFVLEDIKVIPTFNRSFLLDKFINTKVPIRVSCLKNEYHVYSKIELEKIVALEYNVSQMLLPNYPLSVERLKYLKELLLCIEKANFDVPVYDFTSKKEINKTKLLSLDLK